MQATIAATRFASGRLASIHPDATPTSWKSQVVAGENAIIAVRFSVPIFTTEEKLKYIMSVRTAPPTSHPTGR